MSVSWIEITEADVLTVMSGPELAAYRAAALKAGQADPLAPTIAQVIKEVRGYIGGCVKNRLADGETIPPSLLMAALDIIASRIPQRVNESPEQGRKDKENAAIALLKDVSTCKFAIEQPSSPDAAQESGGKVEVVHRRPPNAGRDNLQGL